MRFTDLPHEAIEQILVLCDPLDVAAVAQTGSLLRHSVYHADSSSVWRGLYLAQPFDDPRQCVRQDGTPRPPINWKAELKRIIRARTVVGDLKLCRPREYGVILQTLLDMVCWVPPLPYVDSPDISRNLLWVAAVLRHGFLDDAEKTLIMSKSEKQIHARMHAYYGLTKADIKGSSRVRSRAMVYDMRNYRWDNSFGPLTDTGEVNWEHIQTLHHVVSMHLVGLREDEEFEFAIFPMSLPFTQVTMPPIVECANNEGEEQFDDWAGVEGQWSVSFCFCDHRELLAYNESLMPGSESLNPILFEANNFQEVFRTLEVEIRVTHNEKNSQNPTAPPTIYFGGQMAEPSTSTMTGRVSMSREGYVQWHFVSGDQGNAIWSSEGIQMGGLRSSFGVLGSWTTIFHDNADPVGPFWLHKKPLRNQ